MSAGNQDNPTVTQLLCVLDEAGKVVDVTGGIPSLQSDSVSALCGQYIADFCHPRDRRALLHAIQEARKNKSQTLLIRIRDKNGDWWNVSCTVYWSQSTGMWFCQLHEQHLGQEEELLDLTISTLPGTFYIFNQNGTMLRWNRNVETIFGYQEREVAKMNVLSFVAPNYQQLVTRRIAECFEKGEADVEADLIDKAGNIHPFMLSGRAFDYNGSRCVVGVGHDISERRNTEVALKLNEERFRGVSRLSTDVIWDWDLVNDTVWWSEGISTLFGYTNSRERNTGNWRFKHVHPDDRKRVESGLKDYIKRGTGIWEDEYRFELAYGSYITVSDRGHVTTDDQGRPVRMLGAMVDVTEQRRAAEAERLAASALENTAEGVMILDASHRIVSVNRAFSTITGYSAEEVIGSTPKHFGSQGEMKAFFKKLWDVVASNGYWQGEVLNRRKQGELYAELLSVSAVRDDNKHVSHYVAVFNDISHFKEYEKRLDYLAGHDLLTGLPNRMLFQQRGAESISSAHRQQCMVSVLSVDIDAFKSVNDSLGYHVGDELLQAIANRLQENAGSGNMVFRTSGDQFAVLLNGIKHTGDAAEKADQLLEALALPFDVAGQQLYVSVNIGISCSPQDADDIQSLLRNAEAAMQLAKQEEPNAFRFFSNRMRENALDALIIANGLRHALERNEFHLEFQPYVDLENGKVRGCETLVRWQHPDRGQVAPSQFIPVAEQTGLIARLGEWVLWHACEQAARWQQSGLLEFHMAVNLSVRQLRQANFLRHVRNILEEHKLSPRSLVLEITESVMMDNPEKSRRVLSELKEMGIGISIDDFGTGYSSLSYLKNFHVDYLKVDKSFTQGMDRNPDLFAITRAIVAMARTLNIEVIAEGIETNAQLDLIRQVGCHAGQGYLFSRPVLSDTLEKFIFPETAVFRTALFA